MVSNNTNIIFSVPQEPAKQPAKAAAFAIGDVQGAPLGVPLRFDIVNSGLGLLVGRSGSANKVMQVSPTGFNITGTITGDANSTTCTVGTAYNPTTKYLYVGTSNGVEVYDTTTETLVTQIAVTGGAGYMVYVPTVNKVFITNLTIANTINTIDCTTDTLGANVNVGFYGAAAGTGITYASSTGMVYAIALDLQDVTVINPSTLTQTINSYFFATGISVLKYFDETGLIYVGFSDGGAMLVFLFNPITFANDSNTIYVGAGSSIVELQYILGNVYVVSNISGAGRIFSINPTTLAVNDTINFTSSVYDCKYIESNDKLAIAAFSGNAVLFIDASTTYAGGVVETSFPYETTGTISTPFWIFENTSISGSGNVTLFSAQGLASNVTVNMAGAVTYNQFVQSIQGSPVVLIAADYFTASGNTALLTGNINLNYLKPDGESAVDLISLSIDPFQKQISKTGIDMKKFVLDGLSSLTFDIPYGITASLMLYYRDAEDYLLNALQNECLL